jgi:hypothetical protein|nr:MAG TPA: hypothetical protein [Caudoviricetes sp.]
MLVTKAAFLRYQNIFYKKLLATPYKVTLEVVSVHKVEHPEDEFSLEEFVGDSSRTSQMFEFPALYEKEISNRMRDKYGLSKEVNGIIYLSPKQLEPKLGSYQLDWNKTKVHFNGSTQVIDKIIYLEEMYGSCVGIQIFVKDDVRGG